MTSERTERVRGERLLVANRVSRLDWLQRRRAVIARSWYATIAAAALAALIIQVIIAVHAPGSPPGHAVGTLAGGPLATRILRVFSFFTIQSNILAAIVSARLAREYPNCEPQMWRIVRLMALIGITLTGVVYSTVLARIHEPKGWEQVSTNTVFHYLIPLMMVLGWLLFGPRPRFDRSVLVLSLIWPVLWLGYTLAHGASSKWYPYPFVDAATHGYGRVLVNAVLVALVCVTIGALYTLVDRKLHGTPPVGRTAALG